MEAGSLGFNRACPWPRSSAGPSSASRRTCVVAMSSGGSRRDMSKILARSRHRRARHLKRLNRQTPYDQLAQEQENAPSEPPSPGTSAEPPAAGTSDASQDGVEAPAAAALLTNLERLLGPRPSV